MIRVLVFLAVVAVLAFGATWLADHPGTVLISWGGRDVQFSTLTGLVAVLAAAVVLLVAWTLLRFILRLPSVMAVSGRARKRQRGLQALSRGLMAVGSGDVAAAQRHAGDAGRLLGHDPMAMLLRAQTAQLSGDRAESARVFAAMLEHDDTRTLGLRGLHMEAVRAGDTEAAHRYALEAQSIAALPWAGHAVLQHHAADSDWAGALAAVERNAAGRLIDRPTANRQRAVLQTAMALTLEEGAADDALRLAREALRVAPTLVPAAALAGRLLARRGDLRRASKVIEQAYAATPHPDLGAAYVSARPGDSAADRLVRAEMLARQAPGQPESRLLVARAALDARDLPRARQVMAPLVNGEEGQRPTARVCLTMADLEELENGITGALFEWLQRAARAPHDPAWIADGVISDTWAPVSPVTGRIDAFVWDTPREQLSATVDYGRALSRERFDTLLGQREGTGRALARRTGGDLPTLSVEQTDQPDTPAPPVPSPGRVAANAPVASFGRAPDDPGPADRDGVETAAARSPLL